VTDGIPDDVAKFIAEHINSVELLEVLLLLRARAPEAWTAEAVAAELRINPVSARVRLDALASKRFVAPAALDAFHYATTNASADALVRRLADSYARRRVSVIAAIFANPSEEVRAVTDPRELLRGE
jgi:hypothetical protein